MAREGLFFTVVYPQALSFFNDFCTCARKQTLDAFDILVVNDGCEDGDIENALSCLNYTLIPAQGSPSENRQQGIDYAINHGYKYILFSDADDSFTQNRFERTIEEFHNSQADIIVCNLNIVDETLQPLICDYFDNELPTDQFVDAEFIKDKNIFGMSNTAIRLDALKESIMIPETPIVDWFLFTLLLIKGLKAKYITESLVNYRQYAANMIGINKFDVASFKRMAKLKNGHYKLLVENGFCQYKQLYLESSQLLDISDKEISQSVKRGLAKHPQPLWWQIITRNNK